MDWLELAAKSEWPALGAYALWVLRGPISRLLDRMHPTKMDAWGFKAEFARDLDKVDMLTLPKEVQSKHAKAAKPPTLALDAKPTPKLDRENYRFISGLHTVDSPEASVLTDWAALETALQEKAAIVGIGPSVRGLPSRSEWASLGPKVGLTEDETAAVQELRKLRNDVAHATGARISPEEARRYREVVTHLVSKLLSSEQG